MSDVGASAQSFDVALGVASKLVKDGRAQILVVPVLGPRPAVSFGFQRQDPEVRRELSSAGLTDSAFGQELAQISEMLTAAVQGASSGSFVRRQKQQQSEGQAQEGLDDDELKRRFDRITNEFDVSGLRRREWLKRTAKEPALLAVGWEAVSKASDGEVPRPEGPPLPFGVLRLELAANTNHPLGIFSNPISRLTMILDRSDLATLLAALQQLDAQLAELES